MTQIAQASPEVRALTQLIILDPASPVHYLMRGEAWAAIGAFSAAQSDFCTARELAETALATSAWGYLLQSYVDRADAGLRQCGG